MNKQLATLTLAALVALAFAPANALTLPVQTLDQSHNAAVGTMEYFFCPGESDVVGFVGVNNQDGTWTFVVGDVGASCSPWADGNAVIATGSPESGFSGDFSSGGWSIASDGSFSGFATVAVLAAGGTISGNIAGTVA